MRNKIRLPFITLMVFALLTICAAGCRTPDSGTPTESPSPTHTALPPTATPPPTETPTPTATLMPLCTPPPCAANESYYCEGGNCPGGCGTVCATQTPVVYGWWRPAPGDSFHIQYSGEIDLDLPVQVYNLDLFDTPAEDIATLHQRGVHVVCYFSAGTFEDWRPDAEQFPPQVIGSPLEEWEGENWLDVRQSSALKPLMIARLDLAVEKGCDAVDPDNLDGYTNNSGFDLAANDQLAYNLWLAQEAHQRGLGISLKNDLDQIPFLVNVFDFAVNEECFTYNECDRLLPFIRINKAVFGIEYEADPAEFCPQVNQYGFSFVLKEWELDEFAEPCWEE